jgi:hypothetical protein
MEPEQTTPSTKPSGFPFGLKQGKDIAVPHRALNVSHDEPVLIIKKLDSHLGHLPSGPGSAHNFDNDGMLHLRFHPAQVLNIIRKIDLFLTRESMKIWTFMQILENKRVLDYIEAKPETEHGKDTFQKEKEKRKEKRDQLQKQLC